MGNKQSLFCQGLKCYQDLTNSRESDGNLLEQSQQYEIKQKQIVCVPLLNQEVNDILTLMKPLKPQLQSIANPQVFMYNGHVYFGDAIQIVGKKIPHGYGKLYESNGSLLIAKFCNGKPIHQFFFIKPNGDYCYGQLQNNSQNYQNCVYHQSQFQYRGNIQNYLFQGQGTLYNKNYELKGDFKRNKLINGRLAWHHKLQKLTYVGQFDENMLFHGKGMLQDSNGKYEGQFSKNLKQGHGKYTYKNQNYYIGEYKNDKKNGYGTLFSRYGSVLYEGEWEDGMPIQVVTKKSLIKMKSLQKTASQLGSTKLGSLTNLKSSQKLKTKK